MRRRFFVDTFAGTRAAIRGDAAHHLRRVLRAAAGQLYELSDGKTVWLGRIDHVGRDGVEFELVEPLPVSQPAICVVLLLSIIKFDHFELALEKAAELGAREIVPLAAARSASPLVAAAGKRARRWEKILLEAAQQARLLSPPILRPVGRPEEAFQTAQLRRAGLEAAAKEGSFTAGPAEPRSGPADALRRILLSERPQASPLREILASPLAPAAGRGAVDSRAGAMPVADGPGLGPAVAALAIGPEGGWTDQELELARAAGFLEASLSRNILRTETAMIAALAVLQYALGDSRDLV